MSDESDRLDPEWLYIQDTRSPINGQWLRTPVEIHRGDFAFGVWQALAVTLSMPLRKAVEDHLSEHGCQQQVCDEANRLYGLIPNYFLAIA